jgi:hypothetical protein
MSLNGPKRHLVRCKDMSGVEVKADSKANAEFGRDRGSGAPANRPGAPTPQLRQ